jgi:hypothetical protein
MIPGFEKIVEERIKTAHENGSFDNLAGKGKPFVLEDLPVAAGDCRLAHKILKNAGFLPPELELKKQISQTELLLQSTEAGSAHHREVRRKLNYLLTKLDLLRGGISPLITDQYQEKIINKIS